MEIAEFVLQNEGAVVTKAWNGQKAVDIFRKDSVQCTVLTYESHPKMEKSDGFHIAFFYV